MTWRELPDPHYPEYLLWRYRALVLEYRWTHMPHWVPLRCQWYSTPKREAVWENLFLNP
jgi:hypothetical protein